MEKRNCAYCGKAEEDILWIDYRMLNEFDIFICGGWCVIGLEVDDMHSDNWE